jgi:hypothetical protein
MDIVQYSVHLRSELVSLVTGIQNAGFSLYWDNTTPNRVTKSKLCSIYKQYLSQASVFGVYLVTRHSACPHPSHQKCGDEDGYLVSNDYGLDITYNDPDYIWEGRQMYQGERNCSCPCSPELPPVNHWVIEEMIYSRISHPEANRLCNILSDIYMSIQQSDDNHTRSGIREYLLRAILQLNDLIFPMPVEEYIKTLGSV